MQAALSPIPPQAAAPIVISDERPAYRITSQAGFFGPDDTLYPEGTMMYWDEQPSLEMQPLNRLAREAKKKYLESLDDLGKIAAEKLGKGYTGYTNAHENAIEIERLNAKQVQVIGGVPEKKVLGDPSKGAKVETITAGGETPMTGERTKTLSLGKNTVNQKAE
jgi:hypothetical protein